MQFSNSVDLTFMDHLYQTEPFIVCLLIEQYLEVLAHLQILATVLGVHRGQRNISKVVLTQRAVYLKEVQVQVPIALLACMGVGAHA